MVSKDLWGEQSLNNKLCHSFPHTDREDPLSMEQNLYFHIFSECLNEYPCLQLHTTYRIYENLI